MSPKVLLILIAVFAACISTVGIRTAAQTRKTSGVYLTAGDFENGKLSFEGNCGSKAHKLVLHDVLNKPFIDVTHESEKHRYAKSDVFGFHGCDGLNCRFAANLEYQILEARALYIYARYSEWRGRGRHTSTEYYFSVGPDGRILELTRKNLKRAFPDNEKFRDSLDVTFGRRRSLTEYDKAHKMFKVNRLLIASREP